MHYPSRPISKWFAALAAIACVSFGAAAHAADGALEVNLVYFGNQSDTAFLGVNQGVGEGNLQGQFLGQKYNLTVVPSDEIAPMKAPVPAAIFAAADAESLRLLAEFNPGVPIFNIIDEYDDLRALCLPNLLHVIPSRKMREDAAAQWRKKDPKADVTALAWHGDFDKYAGRQLNERFVKAYRQSMDDYAWAGWAAAKMLTDSVARTQSPDPETLLRHLRTDLVFDGQKGVTMNFRPNGQLRQVLLLVREGKIVGEAPVRGVVSGDLDSLGYSNCPAAQAAQ